MTNQARGSSLLQARKAQHLHRHSHKGNNFHNHKRDTNIPLNSHEDERRRQVPDLESVVTEIVQTVSVVQYIDENGAIVEMQTLTSPPVTNLVDQASGLTVDPDVLSVLPTLSAEVPSIDLSLPLPSPAATDSANSQEATPSLTSAPSSAPSGFPSLSGASNSTSTFVAPLFNNSTLAKSLYANTTRASSSSTSSFLSSFASSITEDASSTEAPTITAQNGNGASAPTSNPDGVPTVSSGSGDSGPSTGTPTTTVVASVISSLAGLAVILVIALFLVRWKRRRSADGHMLLGDGDNGNNVRALGAADTAAGGGRSSMADRGLGFAIPSALAALSGKRNSRANSVGRDSNERGFQRISGRKLPSVLHHGGDGYTDPRGSTMSGASSYYRDSRGDWGGPGTPRFAVGSPMRPDSGVPVMHPGPARTPVRTPVTEQSPFDDHFRLSPPPRPDAIGRTHSSQDGSRGSGSRFTEEL